MTATGADGTSEFSQCVQVTESVGTGTIQIELSSQVTVSENVGTVTLPVELVVTGGTLAEATTVDVTASGSTVSGTGYTGISTTLNFGSNLVPDTYTQNLTLTISDDAIDEPIESATLSLGNPVGVSIGATVNATATITDNNTPGSAISALDSATINESGIDSATPFTVVLTSQPSANVVIMLTSSDPTDFVVNLLPLTFTSGNLLILQSRIDRFAL